MLQKLVSFGNSALTSKNETAQKNKVDIISLYYQNVSGLRTKIQSLLSKSSAYELDDIIVFCETCLNKNHLNPELLDPQLFNIYLAVCCGVRGRALASHTDDRGFEPQCGGRLSSLTC